MSLIGDFNGWDSRATPLTKGDEEVWCCFIGAPLNSAMTKGAHYRLHVVASNGVVEEQMPSWASRYASIAPKVNAVVWPIRGPKALEKRLELKGLHLHLLEFDVTLIAPKDGKPELKHCKEVLLMAAKAGYHGVILMNLFGSGDKRSPGSSLLAASPSLVDGLDFGRFLAGAHQLGLAVLLELPMGAKSSYLPQHFFDQEGLFDFSKKQVNRYLLHAVQPLAYLLLKAFQRPTAEALARPRHRWPAPLGALYRLDQLLGPLPAACQRPAAPGRGPGGGQRPPVGRPLPAFGAGRLRLQPLPALRGPRLRPLAAARGRWEAGDAGGGAHGAAEAEADADLHGVHAGHAGVECIVTV